MNARDIAVSQSPLTPDRPLVYGALLLHFSPEGRPPPGRIAAFAEQAGLQLVSETDADRLVTRLNQSAPVAVVIDATGAAGAAIEMCGRIKGDSFTAIVPVIVYSHDVSRYVAADALEAGADEVLTGALSERESALRLRIALRRADRDVGVHPSTRLPGATGIERDIAERLAAEETFAVCYADIDHFKEFNDRYGYNHGDRVILILSRILRDVVRGHSPSGFVGHIGGDDFIFNVPIADWRRCCEDVVTIFDELLPLQYTPADRDRGFFVGKDRRGVIYDVPLMTLSIGVVSNRARHFEHPAEISELATEMKSFSKTLPGSTYAIDRRQRDNPNVRN